MGNGRAEAGAPSNISALLRGLRVSAVTSGEGRKLVDTHREAFKGERGVRGRMSALAWAAVVGIVAAGGAFVYFLLQLRKAP